MNTKRTIFNRISFDVVPGTIKLLSSEDIGGSGEKNALMYACVNRTAESVKIVEYIVKQGANVNSYDQNNATPLMYAVGNPVSQSACLIIDLLLSNGADINAQDYRGDTALMRAVQPPFRDLSIISHLLQKGADLTIRNNEFETALDLAKKCNNTQAVKLLEEFGV